MTFVLVLKLVKKPQISPVFSYQLSREKSRLQGAEMCSSRCSLVCYPEFKTPLGVCFFSFGNQ